MNLDQALDTVASTLSSEDAVHDALHTLRAAVADIARLRNVERAALSVALSAQVDPAAHRYLIPAGPFDVMRRRLEPIHR
jgi:hypothetical protein